MALPKISYPTFTITLPSNGRKVTFRPFLVKEEKILLMAKESTTGESDDDVYEAITQIVNACVVDDDFDVNKAATFDLEYIFIQLRSKSVGNLITATVKDAEDKKEYKVEVNLDDVKITTGTEKDNKIKLGDINNTYLKLRYPSARDLIDAAKFAKSMSGEADLVMSLTKFCITELYDSNPDVVYFWNENTDEEKIEFLENINGDAYAAIADYFSGMPSLEHEVFYKNSKGNQRSVIFRSINDFFHF